MDYSYTSIEEGGAGIATWWIPRIYTMVSDATPLTSSINTTIATNETVIVMTHPEEGGIPADYRAALAAHMVREA